MSLNEQQIKAINHDYGNILVSASAGSGKTHTMIERVKRLVIEKGVKINEVLAVTFTESAAQDMKQKLKNALTKVVSSEPSGSLNGEKIKSCEEQLAEVDTADISTMHAFCAKLIRSYFFICDLSPDFKILDAADAEVIKNSAIERTFREFYDQGEDWFLSLVDRHSQGRKDANLKSLILSAYDFCDSEAEPLKIAKLYKDIYTESRFESLLETYKGQLDEYFKRFLDSANFARRVFIDAGKEKALAFTELLIENINFALNAKNLYQLNTLKNFKLPLTVERNLDEFCKEQKDIVAEVRNEFSEILEDALSVISVDKQKDLEKFLLCGEHTEQFVKVLERYKEIYEQLKREENALDFNDLEHFALQILSDEQVNQEVKNKYKFIFVDEFQDVNGVQDEIISKIERDNVFMVGDAKQSIYGFRGCRAKFFMEKDKSMSENNQTVVRLNHNYRSAKEVINFVNRVFNFCMTESVYGESYQQRSQLQSGGIYPEEMVGRAELHLLLKEEKKQTKVEEARIYDIINADAEQDDTGGLRAAMQVAEIIIDERKKKIYDVKAENERLVQYNDIAILTRNKSGAYVTDLVKGLRKLGIPVTADLNENVCDYPEVMVMINALKLTDCFIQDLPLASTLKSPIGGFTEEELFEIACYYRDNVGKHGGFTDAFNEYLNNAKTPLQVRLAEFKAYFDRIRLLSDFVGAHGVMQKLISDKNLEAHLYAKKDGVDKVDRLNRFMQASIVNGKTLTVREFLKRVENCPEAFDISPFASENTVKVMTIHSSKGLEFPVVIVCGLERPFNREDDNSEILLDREYGFALKYYDQDKREIEETILRNLIRNNFEIQRIQEEMRLFYVALTRATYSLHLVVEGKENTRKEEFSYASKFYHFIPKAINESQSDYQNVKTQVREAHPRKVIIGKADKEFAEKIKKAIEFSYPHQDDVTLPLKSSVTELSAKNDDVILTHVLFDEQSPDTERGTIAHKLLEHYDFSSEDNVYKQAERLVEKGIILDSEISKINLERIAVAIDSGVFKDVKDKKLFREQPFLFNIPANKVFETESQTSVLVQGVIDLLVVDGETARIIDYKYSSLDGVSLKNKYDKQLNLYADAVESVLNKRVTKKTLVNIFTGETVSID